MCACLLQEHWATALKTLTLTLDEVVHIRSVLTKAELEGLPLDGDLKDDVAKGKVSWPLFTFKGGKKNNASLLRSTVCFNSTSAVQLNYIRSCFSRLPLSS